MIKKESKQQHQLNSKTPFGIRKKMHLKIKGCTRKKTDFLHSTAEYLSRIRTLVNYVQVYWSHIEMWTFSRTHTGFIFLESPWHNLKKQ
jgi:hypothetical protein